MDPRELFSSLPTRDLSATELVQELARVRATHFARLPVEVGIDELNSLARKTGWLTTSPSGSSARFGDPNGAVTPLR